MIDLMMKKYDIVWPFVILFFANLLFACLNIHFKHFGMFTFSFTVTCVMAFMSFVRRESFQEKCENCEHQSKSAWKSFWGMKKYQKCNLPIYGMKSYYSTQRSLDYENTCGPNAKFFKISLESLSKDVVKQDCFKDYFKN